MKSVEIVKIEKIIPIYKEGTEATSIEVVKISCNDDKLEFNIVAQKGLYTIGDKAIYIMPDYCIPNNELFRSFHEPFGDPKKSKLGSKGRIKAISFNFYFENVFDKIYSNGILLPLNIVSDYLKVDVENIDNLEDALGVFKYVADDSAESSSSGLTKGDFPSFMYVTDENRAELNRKSIDNCFENKTILSGSIKRDGSSISLYLKKNSETGEYEKGICSRKQEKKLEQLYVSGYIDDNGNKLHQYYDKDLKKSGFYNDVEQKFYTNEDIAKLGYKEILTEVRDSFVDTVNKHDYLNKLEKYCKDNNIQLALRGELVGGSGGSKGSGKSLNTDAKGDSKVIFFGVDDLSSGHSKRLNYSNEYNLEKVSKDLNLEYTESIFEGVFSYDDLIKKCKEIFKHIKDTEGRIIEGIVVRSKYTNELSVKVLNDEYDSKK